MLVKYLNLYTLILFFLLQFLEDKCRYIVDGFEIVIHQITIFNLNMKFIFQKVN